MSTMTKAASERVDWVDYAKGFCIVFVVMMHSTLGVEAAAGQEGWMHYVVAFAKPFRMPDFFLISGLFLARVIDRDWVTYLDRKVVHFVYFYVLWVTIQFAFKAPGLMAAHGPLGVAGLYLQAYVEPFGTLWFIYLLPIFFVVTKLRATSRRSRSGCLRPRSNSHRSRPARRSSTSSRRASSTSTPATSWPRASSASRPACSVAGLGRRRARALGRGQPSVGRTRLVRASACLARPRPCRRHRGRKRLGAARQG